MFTRNIVETFAGETVGDGFVKRLHPTSLHFPTSRPSGRKMDSRNVQASDGWAKNAHTSQKVQARLGGRFHEALCAIL